MDALTTFDEMTEAELWEAGDGTAAMAARWREQKGSEELGLYFDQWAHRFRQEAAARRGAAPSPAECDFPTLRQASVEELTEAHRFCRVVSDTSAGDKLVQAVAGLIVFPIEVALVGRDAVEPEPVPGPPVGGIQ